jgi:seryl-tRNA synthetase
MLDKLKEYKELITIMVFFIGGFVWLESHFPTKSDLKSEIASLNCLLEKYMTLTQLQIQGQDLEKKIHEIDVKITSALSDNKKVELSPAMEYVLTELKQDLKNNQDKLRENKKEMEKINNDLQKNVCVKVMP